MKPTIVLHEAAGVTRRNHRRFALSALVLASVMLTCLSARAKHNHGSGHSRQGQFQYQQTNLVSDLPDIAAIQDINLVNAWGVAFTPTGPFWVNATESGLALVYAVTNDANGVNHVAKLPLEVTIPGEGNATGLAYNDTSGFNSNVFLFVSEDGTISGWRPALGTAAEALTTRTGAVYKGLSVITTATGPMLLAANFSEATLDVYDTNLTLIGQFSDPDAPEDYAPFNVQLAAGQVFVTFAKQDEEKEDDVTGPGFGFIDIFLPESRTFQRFATGTDAGGDLDEINAPWGVALAPKGFGDHGDQLLIGNFGSGTIMTFDADGDFRGLLEGVDGEAVSIDGLWALTFGNGGRAGVEDTLYFTAGPEDETHGLFGSLEPIRAAVRGHGHGRNHGNGNGNGNGGDDDDNNRGGAGNSRRK